MCLQPGWYKHNISPVISPVITLIAPETLYWLEIVAQAQFSLVRNPKKRNIPYLEEDQHEQYIKDGGSGLSLNEVPLPCGWSCLME